MLGTNKCRTGLSPLLRFDETIHQGLSIFDCVDETMANGRSPGERRLDGTRFVASSLSSASELNLIVCCANNKVVANTRGAGLLPSLRGGDTICSLYPCDRRLDETVAVASLSSAALELKLIVGCGN